GIWNSAAASGERVPDSAVGKSATSASPITGRPGRNLSVAGLGVDSVWMNMGLSVALYVDPGARRIKACGKPSEIRGYSLLLPVAVAGGFGALRAAKFRGHLLRPFVLAALFGFGGGAFAGLADAAGDLGLGEFLRFLVGHGWSIHQRGMSNTTSIADGLPARAAALQVLSDVLRKRRP